MKETTTQTLRDSAFVRWTALLLLAGFVCGNAWPLFCTALGCFLSPAAVCLPLAHYSAPQGGEEE